MGHWLRVWGAAALVAMAAGAPWAIESDAATRTVSGRVTYQGNPVPGTRVTLNWGRGQVDLTTDASGRYSHGKVPDGSRVFIHVRPPVHMRYAYRNWGTEEVEGDLVKDFALQKGHLLSGQVVRSGGTPYRNGGWLGLTGLEGQLAEGEWHGDVIEAETGRFELVVLPDIYVLLGELMTGPGFWPYPRLDLRTGDAVEQTVVLSMSPVNPIPVEPPDASKIRFGTPGPLAERTVTGVAGAALPLCKVVLVNLHTGHQASAVSEADGRFSARLYAPAGSAVMIKHGPPSVRWRDLKTGLSEGINPFPGTIVHVPMDSGRRGSGKPFATAGAVEVFADDDGTTLNYVGAAWALDGVMDGPGTDDTIEIVGRLRIHSPAIREDMETSGVQVNGWAGFMMLFDARGRARAPVNRFMSTVLTPTGLPVQGPQEATVWPGAPVHVTGISASGPGEIQGTLTASLKVPEDLPPGTYAPVLDLRFDGIPTTTDWLAANVVRGAYHARRALLPPLQVGSAAPPRLIWRLMMEEYSQGIRGAGAREDVGDFQLASQIVTQGAPYCLSLVDVESGQRVRYRLEPYLPMISFTDRRMPAPPLIPFELPGGELQVRVEKPDGSVTDLGKDLFAQSFIRTRTTRLGHDLNPGTVQLNDVYSLMAGGDQFHFAFDQYGHHVIRMTGRIRDLWGNVYAGEGTYDVWVAYPLDLDPGALPGTPLEVGDALCTTVQVLPRVPAQVEMVITHLPDSDPARAVVHHLRGRANAYGYAALRDPAAHFSAPGEYRVDLTASFTDAYGRRHMGVMTWGGVVETPESALVAHGRRGVDSLEAIPRQSWYFLCRDLEIPAGAISHSFNPYFNGDVLWSRMSDGPCGGDSLVLGASVQDLVGRIEALIRERGRALETGLSLPGTFEERLAGGELPLFVTTRSGLPVQVTPADMEQVAYSYRYSERPGVRVREVISEDGET